MNRPFRIAVLPGDGIGKEVMPEGLRVLDAAAKKFGLKLEYRHFDWASCDYFQKTGKMMPDDWKAHLTECDAIYFGAVGMPNIVPDHVSLYGSLLKFRREFDQYINLRPVRLFDGVPCPLANRKAGDIDFFVVRENTEGEYSAVGGRMFEGTDREIVLQESIFTRTGVDRVLKFAFELATRRARKHVTIATKSNGIAISMPYWDERAAEMGKQYPQISTDKQHIDILSARFVLQPDRFDVVVASNLFGDILSDLTAELSGSLGLGGSLNAGDHFAMGQAAHGSAPDIAGKDIANPFSLMTSAAMLLNWFGARKQLNNYVLAAQALEKAIEEAIDARETTKDIGGNLGTSATGQAIVKKILLAA